MMLRDFIDRCAKALSLDPPNVRVTFSVGRINGVEGIHCKVTTTTSQAVAFFGAGESETAAMLATVEEIDKVQIMTLEGQIAKLEKRALEAKATAAAAERERDAKEKELRRSQERAARAAKAFQAALSGGDDDERPALPRAAKSDG